jgi:hypothetical protein
LLLSAVCPFRRLPPIASAATPTIRADKTSPAAELNQPLHLTPLHFILVLQPNKRILIMASELDLDSIYQFAIQLGKDAGRLLQDAAQRRMNGDDQLEEVEKLNSVDIVTKTDEGEEYRHLRWAELLQDVPFVREC